LKPERQTTVEGSFRTSRFAIIRNDKASNNSSSIEKTKNSASNSTCNAVATSTHSQTRESAQAFNVISRKSKPESLEPPIIEEEVGFEDKLQ
jgi:uncharacterized protein YqeY